MRLDDKNPNYPDDLTIPSRVNAHHPRQYDKRLVELRLRPGCSRGEGLPTAQEQGAATIPYAADVKHDGRTHHIETENDDTEAPGVPAKWFNYADDDHGGLRSTATVDAEQIRRGQLAPLEVEELAERLGVAVSTVCAGRRR